MCTMPSPPPTSHAPVDDPRRSSASEEKEHTCKEWFLRAYQRLRPSTVQDGGGRSRDSRVLCIEDGRSRGHESSSRRSSGSRTSRSMNDTKTNGAKSRGNDSCSRDSRHDRRDSKDKNPGCDARRRSLRGLDRLQMPSADHRDAGRQDDSSTNAHRIAESRGAAPKRQNRETIANTGGMEPSVESRDGLEPESDVLLSSMAESYREDPPSNPQHDADGSLCDPPEQGYRSARDSSSWSASGIDPCECETDTRARRDPSFYPERDPSDCSREGWERAATGEHGRDGLRKPLDLDEGFRSAHNLRSHRERASQDFSFHPREGASYCSKEGGASRGDDSYSHLDESCSTMEPAGRHRMGRDPVSSDSVTSERGARSRGGDSFNASEESFQTRESEYYVHAGRAASSYVRSTTSKMNTSKDKNSSLMW